MKLHKRGFTLIELLVVVLIIGILAAVAVPQYQKAVDKSRMVLAMQIAQQVAAAEDRFFLEHGEYATDMSQLDLDWSCDKSGKCKDGWSISMGALGPMVFLPKKWTGNATARVEYYIISRVPRKKFCVGTTARWINVCKTLGGVPSPGNETWLFELP